MDFLSFYDLYFDDVYRYIYFKTGNQWDTDDLVSAVFLKAFEKFPSVTGSHKAWLFTIARNTVIDHYRKKKDITVGEDMERYTYLYCFEEELEKQDEVNCLKKSLGALTKEELELINLRYFAELKYWEIGQLTGKTENAVKLKFMRVKEKLKALVKVCMEG
ncbi:ECF subfamily RNA polymerase sigma-24 subunit [Thermincola ferriacetica]|uniref:ECF subfamily RNA polymerase sigma-24 subunit n=1 Tax=Thermincola ferriacetica TaxID=281456 RepID=A0A0L6W3G2_9FIRM|nr:RNA polymerase sigma factor [Thermincola ferriacetica]KNZ69996.1 ECF subfamily RNA polymerase sigma-24 subunit [Thermincola ferriacetica]